MVFVFRLAEELSRIYRVLIRHQLSSRFFNPIQYRSLSNTSKNQDNEKENDLGINTEMYKPSTTKKETHVPDDLHSGQPTETFDAPPRSTATLTGSGKFWFVR